MMSCASFPSEERSLFDAEFLHGEERDASCSTTGPSTVVGSPAPSFIKVPIASTPTPLPMAKFSILIMLNAVVPLAFELIYPFINAMVIEVGITNDPERVGFYSGLVESVFSLTGFVMILPCGYLSDTFGRKPVILFGMGGLAVSMVCFGLSKSMMGIIASRCIGGALGASWAAIKVMTGEMTDKSNQDLAFSSLQISYRIGQVVGLPLGGLLAHPERRFSLFHVPFWAEYPYLLPCLVGAAFALFSVIAGVLFIEETLPSKRRRKLAKRTTSYGSTSTTSTLVEPTSNTGQPYVQKCGAAENNARTQGTWSLVMTRPVVALLLSNGLMCLASEIVFSVYPLFAYTPIASGGLGMSEAEIGTQMAIRSVIHIGLMIGYNQVTSRVKALNVYKCAMAVWPVVILGFPALNWVVRTQPKGNESLVFFIAQLMFYTLWSVGGFCWVCIGALVNDTAPCAEALSLINSVAQMSTVLPQAISPALGNSLFAVSVYQGVLGGNMIWVALFMFTGFAAYHSLSLQESMHDWRESGGWDEEE